MNGFDLFGIIRKGAEKIAQLATTTKVAATIATVAVTGGTGAVIKYVAPVESQQPQITEPARAPIADARQLAPAPEQVAHAQNSEAHQENHSPHQNSLNPSELPNVSENKLPPQGKPDSLLDDLSKRVPVGLSKTDTPASKKNSTTPKPAAPPASKTTSGDGNGEGRVLPAAALSTPAPASSGATKVASGVASSTSTNESTTPVVTISSPVTNFQIYSANKTSITVSGTCSEEGLPVAVTATDGTTAVTASPAPTCSSAAFSVSVNVSSLADGSVTFMAQQTNTDSVIGSNTKLTQKDATAPTTPSGLALQTPSTSPKNISAPVIRISGLTSGNSVGLYADSSCTLPTLKASGTASGATLDLTSSALTEATHSFYSTSTDPAGNVSACSTATVSYQYDITPPTLAITAPAVNAIINSANVAAFTVSGTCSDNDRNVTVASGAVTGTVACAGGVWSKTLDYSSIASGNLTVTADMSDVAGNNAIQATRVFVKDTTAPTAPSGLALQSPASSPNTDSTPTIRISGLTSGDSVKLYSNDTCTTEKASGTASGATLDLTSSTLTAATYNFYSTSTDPAGNVSACSTATVAYQYDSSVPTLAITAPAISAWANSANIAAFTVSGTCSVDGRDVTVASGAVTGTVACASGTWSKTLDYSSIAQGNFTVTADMTNAAGSAAIQATRLFVKDTTAPTTPSALALVTPATSPGNSATPTIRMSGLTSGDSVKLYSNDTCTTEKASGTASGATLDLTSSTLTAATYNFYSTSTDPAGNVSACSTATVAYQYDSSVPTLAITAPAISAWANSANIAAFTVSGTCSEEGRNVTVASGAVTGTVACASGTWSKTLDYSSIAQGNFTVTADMTNAAGSAAIQATRVFVKDTTAPTTPSALALVTPATSPGNSATPTIRISGLTSGDSVKLYSNDTCTTEKASGTASGATLDLTSSTLTAATYNFYSTSTDPAGNVSACSTATVAYQYDSSVPTLAITAPAINAWANSANIAAFTVSGTCSVDGRDVTVASGAVTGTVACASGIWSKTLDYSSLAQGNFTVTADMTNAAGSAAIQATRVFVKDTTAPTAPSALALQSPATSPNTDSTPTIRISGLTSGNTAGLYADSGCTLPALKGSDTAAGATLDITSSAVTEAAHSFYANTTDPAGNVSDCSTATVSYTYDISVPTLAITSPVANTYANAANFTAFTVSGTCSESGRTVYVVTGAVSATPTCTGGNTWTTDLDLSVIAQGDFTVAADLEDASGNDAVQATRVFKKDTVAPSAPTVLTLQSPATSPGIDSTPTITVDGLTNGNTAALYTDSSCTLPALKGSGSATGATLNVTSSAVTAASHTFYSLQTDPAGNSSSCSTANVVYEYDNSAPTLAITSPAANSYANATTVSAFTASGTCSEVGRTVTVASGAVTGTVACAGDNTWSKNLDYTSLSDGDFTVTADMSDVAGNNATQATRVYKKDTVAPVELTFGGTPLRAPASSPGSSATPQIRVSAVVSGYSVKLYSNNTCTTEKASGTASGTTIDLTSSAVTTGSYNFYADATDPAGNRSICSTTSVPYEYDDTVPTIAITSPAANTYANIANIAAFTVSGTCSEAGQTVTVASGAVSGTVACSGGSTWTKTLDYTSLGQGDFTVTADIDDAAGNHAVQATRVFKKDTIAAGIPSALALQSPATTPNTDSTPTIRISGLTSGNVVTLFADSSCTAPTIKATGTSAAVTHDLTSSALTEAAHTFYATQTDVAGNESSCSTASVTYTYDASNPTLAITSPAANSFTNGTTVSSFTVSGTCSETGQTVTVASGAVSGTVACSGGNTWTKALNYSSLGEGDFTVTADMDDAAGNHATQATRVFKKDTVAPDAPSAIALQSPATSPGIDASPTLRVSGVVSGNTVSFHANSSCTLITLKGTDTAAGVTVDVTASPDLTANTYAFYAKTSDPAGNESACSTANVAYVYDDSPPAVAITSPASNAYANAAGFTSFTVSGTCSEAGRTVYVVTGAVSATPTCSGGNTWTTNLDLSVIAQGDFVVTADHDDAADQDATQATRTFKKDTVVPDAPTALALNSPGTSPNSDSTPTIEVGGVANGYTVKLFTNNTCTTEKASATASGSTINLTSTAVAAASYNFYAKSTDAAGNESACSTDTVAYEYVAPAFAPTAWSMDPTSGTTSANYTPAISATAGATGTLKIYIASTDATCSTQYGADETTTLGTPFTVTSTLATNGIKYFSYIMTDGVTTTDCTSTGLSYTYQTTVTYNFSRTAYTIKETGTYIGASVRISRDVSGLAHDVTLTTSAVSALSGTHFTAGAHTVSFAAGDTFKDVAVGTFTVVDRSATTDYDRYFIGVITSAGTNAAIGTTNMAQVNIMDVDVAGEYFFPHSLFSVSDSSSSINLTVQRMSTGATATVDIEFASGSAIAGSDFTATTVTANFANTTDTEATVSVPIANVASSRSFYAKIKKTTTNTMRAQSIAKVRILDSSESNTCNTAGSPFGGGTGADAANPYLICTLAQMNQITNNKSKFSKVMSDIDLNSGMNQVSTLINGGFTGGFDGNERIFYRFKPTCPVGNYCSMFGVAGNTTIDTAYIISTNILYSIISSGGSHSAILVATNGGTNYHPAKLNYNLVSGYLTLGTNTYNGGLIGHLNINYAVSSSIKVENNLTAGLIYNGGQYTGGMIGMVANSKNDTTVALNYNYNSASLMASATLNGGVIGQYTSAGTNVATQTLTGLENRAPVVGAVANLGGIFGSIGTSPQPLTISNSANYGKISGTTGIGGVSGQNTATTGTVTIDSSTNWGEITATLNYAGGMIGDNTTGTGSITNVTNNINKGVISGVQSTGGMIGRYSHGNYAGITMNLQNNVNSGSVTLNSNNGYGVGGILGGTQFNGLGSGDSLTVSNNSNSGTISGGTSAKAGGIAGDLSTGGTSANGVLNASNNTNTGNVGGNAAYSAGIFATIGGTGSYASLTINNNISTADATITGKAGAYLGGIISSAAFSLGSTVSVDNNSNASTLSNANGAATYGGGIIGAFTISATAATINITNNSNTGSITGASALGGIIGSASNGVASAILNLTGNHSSATITGTGSNNGGLIGVMAQTPSSTTNIKQSYSTGGTVSGTQQVGGLIGYLNGAAGTITLENVYSTNATSSSNATNRNGALVGYCYASGTFAIAINNSYTLSAVTANGTTAIGGICGAVALAGSGAVNYTSSYWLKNAGGTNSAIADDTRQKTTANLQDVATYSGWTFTPTGGAFWSMGTYPELVP